MPGYDTLGTLKLLRTTPDIARYDHSWFILTQTIIEHEFALSGSEQNPDITNHELRLLIRTRLGHGAPPPVEAFKQNGTDFVVSDGLADLVEQMNGLTDEPLLSYSQIEEQIEQRDAELKNPFSKDIQVMGIRNARRYLCTASPGWPGHTGFSTRRTVR